MNEEEKKLPFWNVPLGLLLIIAMFLPMMGWWGNIIGFIIGVGFIADTFLMYVFVGKRAAVSWCVFLMGLSIIIFTVSISG